MRSVCLVLAFVVLVALVPASASAGYRHFCTFGSNVCFTQEAYGDPSCEEHYVAEDRLHFDLLVAILTVRGYRECPPEGFGQDRHGLQAHAMATGEREADAHWYEERPDRCRVVVLLVVPPAGTRSHGLDCVAGGPPDPGWGVLLP